MAKARTIEALAAAAVLLAGCGNDGMEGSTLRVAVVGSQGLARHLEAEATRPTLIARDGAGQIVPALATSWRFVDDGRSLILRLRPVKWSDDSELVSKQVVDALRRAATRREPALFHAGVENAAAIAARRLPAARLGVRAPISRVVELRLAAASPLLLDWLVDPGLAIDQSGRKAPRSPAAAAVPAPTLAAYDAVGPADKRVLTRRSAIPAPDRLPAQISIASGSDSNAAIAAFRRGDVDIVFGDGLGGLGNARAGSRPNVLQFDPTWAVYGYAANAKKGPLADPGVRRALAMVIDRAALAGQFGIAGIEPVEGLLPPSVSEARVSAATALVEDTLAARQTEAVRLLEEAGWTAEKPLRVTLLLPRERDHRSVAERVAADWAAIGVTLAVSEVDDIERQMARGEFDLAVDERTFAVPDPVAMLARWRCGAGLHCNSAADDLLDEAMLALPAARPALVAQAETAMMTGPPMISLFTPVRWALVARGVTGWTPNRAGSHPLSRLSVKGR